MAIYTNAAARPREELSRAILQGAALNKTLIWDKILPPLPINKRTAHMPKFSIAGGNLERIITDLSSDGANIPRMTAKVEDFNFSIGIRKQEIAIPIEAEMDYADILSLESMWSTNLGQRMLSLTLEYLAGNAIFSTANFGSATNSEIAYTTANLGTFKFAADIYAAIERVRNQGEEPDTIILSNRGIQRVAQDSATINFVIGQLGAGSMVTGNSLQKAFSEEGIANVFVGRSMYNSAGQNQTPVMTRIWSDSYIWVGRSGFKNDTSDAGIPIIDGVGGTAYWEPYGLFVGESYREEKIESQIVRGKTSGAPTIFNPNCGTLIATQYA